MSASRQEMAAAAAIAEHFEATAINERGDVDEVMAFFAGWRLGNSRDRGVEPSLRDYDDWQRGETAVVLPKLWVRCEKPGTHVEHQRDVEIDGQMTTVVCDGEAREEDIKW